jgi:integrase
MKEPKKERNLKQIDGKWYFDFSFGGKRYIRLGGSTKQAAKDAMVRLRVELLNKPEADGRYAIEAEDPLFPDFAKEFIELYAKAKKRSWQRDEYSIARLGAFFGRRRLSQISLLLIEKYKLERKAVVSTATINRELACLKTILGVAIDWKKLVAGFPLKKIELAKENNTRSRVLLPIEEMVLMAEAAPHLRPMITLALNTGMRLGEILKLRLEHINFTTRMITVPAENSKSKKSRQIPMNEMVLDLIRGLAPAEGFIFRKRYGEPYDDIGDGFKAACVRAKINAMRFHDLRHSFATRFIEVGGNVVLLSKILGHSTISITYNRYCHPSNDAMLAAVENMAGKPAQHERQGERLPVYTSVSSSKIDN